MKNIIKISDIRIPKVFLNHPPARRKIDDKRDRIDLLGKQNKPIIIDENNLITDGYATLLALQELGYTECWYRRQNTYGNYEKNQLDDYHNVPTTYIYGIHPNSTSKTPKEYTWRVPNAQRNTIYSEILPGDMVMCETKFGLAPVIVTKIETLDKCPVKGRVKKFVRKIKKAKDEE